jgi:hypothetical protein
MVNPLVLPRTTREYVHVPVPGNPDLTTAPSLAFLTTTGPPGDDDWLQATWHEGTARLLIGPDGGAVQLSPGRYRIWIRLTAGAERPERNAGLLIIT